MNRRDGGFVTDIQRFSLHDGPGIRTTVFLQGCHLRCQWCHNPETFSAGPALLFHSAKCIACGECARRCGRGAHSFALSGEHLFDRDRCESDGECAKACPTGALELSSRWMTVDDVVAEVMEDRAFYGDDGGLTLSGGEPVLQGQFALTVLRACRAAAVGTALETSLCYPKDRLAPLLDHVDLVMFDVKAGDDAGHRRWTGVSNRHFHENLECLRRRRVPLIARTPLIAGVNDDDASVSHIIESLADLPWLHYWELLPYHPLGATKYRALGVSEPLFAPPDAERIGRIAAMGRQAGLIVFVDGRESADEV